MSDTITNARRAEAATFDGYLGHRPMHRVANLVIAAGAEFRTKSELEAEIVKIYSRPVVRSASFAPNSTLQEADSNLREEDNYFKLLEIMAAEEDGVIDLTDKSGMEPGIEQELGFASSATQDVSTPILLSEEDRTVSPYHRDRLTPADVKNGFDVSPSIDRLFRLAGEGQIDFDGLSSFQSDEAIRIRDMV